MVMQYQDKSCHLTDIYTIYLGVRVIVTMHLACRVDNSEVLV